MTTVTFPYIEDYIEFIAGLRDISGKALGMFSEVPCPISLARYDVQIISSLAEQTRGGKGYTDKQGALAIRLVDKYRRQLSKLAVPVSVPEILDNFKLAIRIMDRTKSITLVDGDIVIKFPFDTKLIDSIKTSRQQCQGRIAFDNDGRVWKAGLTEYMINWAVTIGQANGFDISAEIMDIYSKILELEQTEYKIELVLAHDEFAITNAPTSLTDYINEHLGGFGTANYINLIDNAEIMGYTVHPAVYNQLPEDTTPAMLHMLALKQHTISKDELDMNTIIAYAKMVNRLPVYVYDTGLPKRNTDEIIYLNKNIGLEVKPRLLVTMSAIMLGSKKQAWLANAEKIFVIE